jgi:hypothetical protein
MSRKSAAFGLESCWLFLLLLSLAMISITPVLAHRVVLTPKEAVEYALTVEKLEADLYRRAFGILQSQDKLF